MESESRLCAYVFVDYGEDTGEEIHTACETAEGDHPYVFNKYDESYHPFALPAEVGQDDEAD